MPPSKSLNNSNTGLCQPCSYPIISMVPTNFNMKEDSPVLQPLASTNRDQNSQEFSKTTTCSCKPNCSCCRSKSVTSQLKLCKYQQPEVRASYKPLRYYTPPATKIGNKTIYRESYLPRERIRSEQFKPSDNLATGEGKVSNDTVHNTSYKRYDGALPAFPHYPCRHNLLGVGPLQDETTHKRDYIPKPIDKTQSFKPPPVVFSNKFPLSDKTTNRLSYTSVGINQAKAKSYRPCVGYKAATDKMSCDTTHRLSYSAYEPQKPADKPWVVKKSYLRPTIQMSDNTVYTASYQPRNGDARQKPFKPNASYLPPSFKMEDGTTYRKSYQPNQLEKTTSYRPQNSINSVEGKISGDTVHKLSYQGYKNALPACIIKPRTRKYTNDDPMQDITTHRNDYVQKPIERQMSFRPMGSFRASDIPLSDQTTNRLSYKPYDVNTARVQPTHLKEEIPKPTGKVESKTTHSISYLPWKQQQKEEFPWFPHGKYRQPTLRMDSNTIHSLSYQLPGSYVDCSINDPDCIPCPQAGGNSNDYSEPCCQSCCGQFPVAAC